LIFKHAGGTKLPLAELDRGEVFGEMSFFNFLCEPRSASVEALEDVKLEVWHPARLIEEYEHMPFLLIYLCRQTLDRVLRMNRIIDELSTKKRRLEEEAKKPVPLGERKHYRKSCDLACNYRGLKDPSGGTDVECTSREAPSWERDRNQLPAAPRDCGHRPRQDTIGEEGHREGPDADGP
jgi:CRP-like cAMP-binding protein